MSTNKQANQPCDESLSNLDKDNQIQEQLKLLKKYQTNIIPSIEEILIEEKRLAKKTEYYHSAWLTGEQQKYINSSEEIKKDYLASQEKLLIEYGHGLIFDEPWENQDFGVQLATLRWVLTGEHGDIGYKRRHG